MVDSQRQRPAPLLPEPAGGPQGFSKSSFFTVLKLENVENSVFSFSGGSPEYGGRTGERHENGFGGARRDGVTPKFEYYEESGGGGVVSSRFGGERSGGRPPGGQRFGGQSGPPVQSRSSRGVVDATDGPQEGAVLMVYGLNMEKMNADRLFNLLCLYGNVFKVFFLLYIMLIKESLFIASWLALDQIPQDERGLCNGPDGRCHIGRKGHLLFERPRILQHENERQVWNRLADLYQVMYLIPFHFLVIPSRPFWQTYQCRTICRTARLHSKATSIVKTTDFSTRTWRPKTGCSRLVKSSISTTRRPVSPRKTCVKFSKKTERLSPPKSGFCRTRVKGLFLSFFFFLIGLDYKLFVSFFR